jgi:hypothetical protein
VVSAPVDTIAFDYAAQSLAVDGKDVYFNAFLGQSGAPASTLARAPKAGGALTEVSTGLEARTFAASDGAIYLESSSALSRVDKVTGRVTALTTQTKSVQPSLVLTGTALFEVANPTTLVVYTNDTPRAGFQSVNGAIAGFGADDETAYWLLNDGSSRTFHQSPVAPLTVQTAQGILPGGAPFGENGYTGMLAVAPNDVVVIAENGNNHDVLAFPRGGGAKRTLATVAALAGVAPLVVGTDVYVALFTGFARVPLSGEAPESVGVGQVYALAADERAVYYRTEKGVFARAR